MVGVLSREPRGNQAKKNGDPLARGVKAPQVAGFSFRIPATFSVDTYTRLRMYPPGMKFYRCSRGIVRPTAEIMRYEDVVREYGPPQYKEAWEIRDQDGNVVQFIQRESFKKE